MRIHTRIIIIFFIAFLALACFTVYIIRDDQNTIKTGNWIKHTLGMIQSMGKYYSNTISYESAAKGYVITGDDQYTRTCTQAADSVMKQLDFLRVQTTGDPDLQGKVRLLKQLTLERISFANEIMDIRKQSVHRAIQMVGSLRGSMMVDSIVKITSGFLQQENNLLTNGIALHKKEDLRSFYSVIFGSIASFFFLIVGLWQVNRELMLRKIAESEAKSSETKYRNLIEDSGVVMFTSDMAGNFTFLSNKVDTLTGYAKSELLGKHYSQLVAPEWLEKVKAMYQSQVNAKTHESLMEFPIVTKAGAKKWVEQMAVLISNGDMLGGFQCIVKDISEKKRIELELKESEFKRKENQYRLQAIIDNTTSLVFIKDLNGRYLLVNKKFQEVLNVTDEFVYGKTDFEFSPKEAAERYKKVDEMVIHTSQPQEVVEDIDMTDGPHYFLITKFPLLDNNRRIFGICGIATDISQRKRYEEQLIEAKLMAENAEKLQEQFLANMSHEIRTPLNGIIGMTNLISDTRLDREQDEFVTTIRESSNNLLVIINDILDFSKIKAGKLTMEQIRFDAKEVLDRTIYSFKHKMEEKGLKLKTNFDSNIPPSLTGDPYRLNQVLVNLIGNAIKFTEKGEITINAALQKFTLDAVYVEFTVTDTGIGVSEDKWATIFESFAQGSSDTTRKYGGTGLGLAITKKLIDLQEGEIEMQSKVGSGTIFRFVIPYLFTNQNIEDTGSKTEDVYISEMKDKQILVAEDNVINQKVVFYTLERVGAHVDITSNGKEAITRLRGDKKYDLILMDIQMPELDGYQTTIFIRTVLKMNLPIIAMTATVLRGEKEKCIQAGMNDYVSKPFAPSDLFKKIAIQISGSPQLPESIQTGKGNDAPDYSLNYLMEMGDDQHIFEILETFLSTTPGMLEEIRQAIQGKNWDTVYQKTHRLRTSFGMLQIHHLMDNMSLIESNARSRINLEQLPLLIDNCLEFYEKIRGSIEEDRTRIGQKVISG